jgi:hypothetical protein
MEETKFTEITEASVFHVNWITTEVEYTSGTSSCIQTDFSEKPILITAFHYFWPKDAESFTGSDDRLCSLRRTIRYGYRR